MHGRVEKLIRDFDSNVSFVETLNLAKKHYAVHTSRLEFTNAGNQKY
jgi:hypothetical protein